MSDQKFWHIDVDRNDKTGSYDVQLRAPGFKDKTEAERFADLLAECMTDITGGWKVRVQ